MLETNLSADEILHNDSLLKANAIKDILVETFNALEFEPISHKYTLGGKQLLSTTQFLDKYMGSFEPYLISETIARAYNKRHQNDRPERHGSYYRRRWDYLADQARFLGSRVHEYSEQYPYFDEPYDYYEQGIVDFFVWFDKHYVLITQEMKLYNKAYLKAGTTDLLALNKATGKIAIFDWKTSENIFKYSKSSKLPEEFGKIPACDMNKYSIQLSDYANMIEIPTELEVGEMYVIWLHDFKPSFKRKMSSSYATYSLAPIQKGDFYAVYPCHDFRKTLLDLYPTIMVSEDKRYTHDLKMTFNKPVEETNEEE